MDLQEHNARQVPWVNYFNAVLPPLGYGALAAVVVMVGSLFDDQEAITDRHAFALGALVCVPSLYRSVSRATKKSGTENTLPDGLSLLRVVAFAAVGLVAGYLLGEWIAGLSYTSSSSRIKSQSAWVFYSPFGYILGVYFAAKVGQRRSRR